MASACQLSTVRPCAGRPQRQARFDPFRRDHHRRPFQYFLAAHVNRNESAFADSPIALTYFMNRVMHITDQEILERHAPYAA